ncbi:hypothetical protein [Micromonospora haikouensis]|uniref:hypothetical protein n=1 Tax=Micromonospora haikouensis TaxID=686309 RepID=UPI003D7157E4
MAIELILASRMRRADELVDLDKKVVRLDGALETLETVRANLLPRVDGEVLAMLDQISLSLGECRRFAAAARREIGRDEARFRRQMLTIGVVGRGGQGKSRFLQRLTGLTDQEIPAARGGFMTGAPSIVQNAPGPTSAEVEFHDQASFLADVISPYYRELGLGNPPRSLAEFDRDQLPALPADSSTRATQAYDHLCSYRDHLDAYRDYLTSLQRVRPVPPDQIVRFVAQHDGEGRQTHEFRAVRRVRISAPFVAQDLGRLAVIDLPGLGDTNLHDEHVLRQALGGQVDLVLFLRRPDPLRDDVHDKDVDLYDVARTALPELPVEQWSFLVLNRVDGGDGDNAAMIGPYAAAVRRSRFRVSGIAVANCTRADEVAEAFAQVVEQAVRSLDELDQTLLERRRLSVATLQAEVLVLVEEAQALIGRAAPSSAWFHRFQQLFNETYRDLTVGLESALTELREGSTEYDEELSVAVAAAIERARAEVVVPAAEEIVARAAIAGSYNSALNDLLNELRSQVSRQFLTLDTVLKLRVGAMHQVIARELAEAGRFRAVQTGDGRAFLEGLAGRLPADGSATELRLGFQILTEFTLNYRGLIQHRVRRVLDKLREDSTRYDPLDGAAGIEAHLQDLVAETLYEIESELETLLFEPREAVYAVAEEFRDRVLRSQGHEDEWRTVYESLRSEVWSEEFEALAANTTLFNQWVGAVDELRAAAGGELDVRS